MKLLPNLGARDAGQRGQTTVEFVIVFPMLVLFFFLMLGFGWLLKDWIIVTNATREATRCAIAASCPSGSNPSVPDAIELAIKRLQQGGVVGSDTSSVQTRLRYVERNGRSGMNEGDSLYVCVEAESRLLSLLLGSVAWIGADPVPRKLRAREEMLVEYAPTVTADEGDGTCDFSG